MSIERWLVRILLFAIVAGLVSGCGSGTDIPPTSVPTVEPTATDLASLVPTLEASSAVATPSGPSAMEVALEHIIRLDGSVLARVNGEEITWEDYEPALRQALTMLNQQYQIDWSDGAMQERLKTVQNDVLKQTVDRWLLRDMAAEQGVALDPAQLEAQIQNEKTQIQGSGRYADWNDFLQKNGLTDKSFTQLIEDTLLVNLMVSQQVVDTQGEQTHLRHIVVTDEATAQKIEAELKAGGDFAALAAQYSIDDQTKDSAGDLGWFSMDLMSPDIKPIADALAPGEFSEPIATQSGYAILMVVERGMHELDSVMLKQKQQEALMSQLDAARATADIEYLVDFTELDAEQP